MKKLFNGLLLMIISLLVFSACSDSYNTSAKNIMYENTKYKFSLNLPQSWQGKYDVVEFEHTPVMAYRFVAKEGKGELFRIEVWPKEEWSKQGEELAKIIHISKIGESGDNIYAFSTPTDVEYDPNNAKEKKEYTTMFDNVESIKASFEVQK